MSFLLQSCHRKCLEKSIIDRCGCTRELNEFINKNKAKMKENDIEYDNKYDDMYSYDPDLRMCNPQNGKQLTKC